MPLRNNWKTLHTMTGDGTALTAAARASAIQAASLYTLSPGYFDAIGKKLIIRAHGRISSLITTPGTARFDVNFLDSAAVNAIVFDSLAILLEDGEAHVDKTWELEIELTARALGTAGNLFGRGKFTSTDINNRFALGANPQGGIVALLPWNTAPAVGANFNTTLAQQIDLRFTQTAATGSLQVHNYDIIAPN